MKRITALLLALVMCFALCACGSTPDPNLKEEDLAGTWSPSLWFLSTQLKLNSDGTYDYGEEKGTFGVLINNVTLSPRHSNSLIFVNIAVTGNIRKLRGYGRKSLENTRERR